MRTEYTNFDLAAEVLRDAHEPMTPNQMWEAGKHLRHKLGKRGKTPDQSFGSKLYTDVKKPSSRFVSVGKPARFWLKDRALPTGYDQKIVESKKKKPSAKPKHKGQEKKREETERLLHPLVRFFLDKNSAFAGSKRIIAKTIDHNKTKPSRISGPAQWAHPDMVGFHMPFGLDSRPHENWLKDVADLNKITDNNALKLYSFELKVKIDKGSYRESFFQAVSNSSWAHEGYLVTAEIKDDAGIRSELGRLSSSFGIGIVLLDLKKFDGNSKVIFPAKQKEILDWEAINKLSQGNPDFSDFIRDVMVSFKEQRELGEFDELIQNPAKYIKKHKMA